MLDALSETALQTLYRRESRSLLQYVCESSPWVATPAKPVFEKLLAFAQNEVTALADLSRFMDHNHVSLPYLGTYPIHFTSYNFMDVRKLVPKIIADLRGHLTHLEADRDSLPEDTRPVVEKLIELRRNHLRELEQLQGS